MGQGDRDLSTPRLAGRRRLSPWRPSAAVLLAALGVAGCGEAPTKSRDDARPLPRYWQGSINGPQPEAWAEGGPSIAPTVARPTARSATNSPSRADATVRTNATPQGRIAAATTGSLLPPQAVGYAYEPAPGDVVVVNELPALTPPSPAAIARAEATLRFPGAAAPVTPTGTLAPPSGERALAAGAGSIAPAQPVAAPTGAVVVERATTKVRRGYELAERGAYFAAKNQFLESLRMIAEAKDQVHGAPRRTLALAAGLRAIDEAADFHAVAASSAPDLKLSVIVASHQTPVAKALAVDDMLAQQLADAYFQYAEQQLGAAVAGEPAGSMALHALGKLHSRLGRVEPEKNPQADARAFALQQAALLARSDNHLAAHELGVLLAESGHYRESDGLLRQVATRAPHPVVYRNLARVERELGRPDLAAMSERQADFLAARGAGGNPNVEWVAADALERTPDALGPPFGASQGPPMTARGPAPVQR